jgi:hypothetical protein
MGTELLIGLTAALGGLALGLGVFVLGRPPPSRPAAQQTRGSLGERLIRHNAAMKGHAPY